MNDTEYQEAKALFAPYPKAMMMRQEIYGFLAKNPEKAFTISEIAKNLQKEYSEVYNACKVLCMKALAKKGEVEIPISLKKPERGMRPTRTVQHVDNWQAGVRKEW